MTHTEHDESRKFPYWRRNLQVLPAANLLCGLGFSLAWPFVPLMVRGLGVQENLETWVGYMLLVFYLISFAVNPIWGGIADHYGRKPMVLRAMLGMGIAMLLFEDFVMPDLQLILLMFVAAFFLTMGHLCIFLAFRFGEVTAVSPFLYTAMVWALIAGFVVFGTLPNALVFVGIGLIVICGVGVVILEGRRVRPEMTGTA